MPCQAWFIVGPSNNTQQCPLVLSTRSLYFLCTVDGRSAGRQACAEILTSWPARRLFWREGRAGRRMSSWWLVTSRSTSRLYRVLCVLRPLLAQVPAAAAHAAPFSRRARRFAVWSGRRILVVCSAYLSRLRSCGSVGSVPGSGVPHTEPPTVPRHAAPWRLAARSPHPHRVEGN